MKPLIEKTSSLYLKRLVRALNEEAMSGNGFMFKPADGRYYLRGNAARFRDGRIECRTVGGGWHAAEPDSFSSVARTEEIVASRKP